MIILFQGINTIILLLSIAMKLAVNLFLFWR